MLDKIKRIDKRFLLIIPVIIVILIVVAFIMLSNKLTKLEKIKIQEISDSVSPYVNEIINNKEEDGSYISFAIDYIYTNQGKTDITIDEIVEVINKYFDKEYSVEKIRELGFTSYLLNRGLTYDTTIAGYKYKNTKTRADIAETPITKYEIKKIKKKNDSKFMVTYNKYVIENPYPLLNYYNEKNGPESDEVIDITAYVKGEATVDTILKYINEEAVSKVGKKDKDLTIEYIIKNDKLKISKIG